MSKYLKKLVSGYLSDRLKGVEEALLVNVVGLSANQTVVLRRQLRDKNIQLMVVKNSMAKRATEGTPLGHAFEEAEGALAIIWGHEDIVSLAKEVDRYSRDADFTGFRARGGVMDGETLTAERVREISSWPSREEQLSILVGQILSPGAELSAQLIGPGGALASQVEQKSKEES